MGVVPREVLLVRSKVACVEFFLCYVVHFRRWHWRFRIPFNSYVPSVSYTSNSVCTLRRRNSLKNLARAHWGCFLVAAVKARGGWQLSFFIIFPSETSHPKQQANNMPPKKKTDAAAADKPKKAKVCYFYAPCLLWSSSTVKRESVCGGGGARWERPRRRWQVSRHETILGEPTLKIAWQWSSSSAAYPPLKMKYISIQIFYLNVHRSLDN